MSKELIDIFSENLQKLMIRQGKTQADICRRFKISSATASDWYNGKKMPRADKLQALATWLGVNLSDLLEEGKTSYYEDENSRELAEFLRENPEYKVLFDASKNVKPSDIDFVRQFIERMGGKTD